MDMQSKVEVPETPIDQAITAINMAPVQKADGQQRSGIVIGKNVRITPVVYIMSMRSLIV